MKDVNNYVHDCWAFIKYSDGTLVAHNRIKYASRQVIKLVFCAFGCGVDEYDKIGCVGLAHDTGIRN